MKVLLDTHAFIWYVEGIPELSQLARETIEHPGNQCMVSYASLWEMSIKISLGKLILKGGFDTLINDIATNGFDLLPIRYAHLKQNTHLAWHHKDPFDRLLIAQCQVENIPVISKDPFFDDYLKGTGVKRIW